MVFNFADNVGTRDILTYTSLQVLVFCLYSGWVRLSTQSGPGSLSLFVSQNIFMSSTIGAQSEVLPITVFSLRDVSHPQNPKRASDALRLSMFAPLFCLYAGRRSQRQKSPPSHVAAPGRPLASHSA